MQWTIEHMPDLSGKTVLITGGNSGIGWEAARACAGAGARVVLACRNADKARSAQEAIRVHYPDAVIDTLQLDVASLASVRAAGHTCREMYERLDILCNNAGVMAVPYLTTADGFEMQLGTNHLGHFALTGELLPLLLNTPASRIVTVSSNAHRFGRIRFDDLQSTRSYNPWMAYGQSKIANLLFTFELQRKLAAAGAETISVACHPGYAATNLPFVGPQMAGASWMEWLSSIGNRVLAQSAASGALPTLYAATAPDVEGGDYIGPDGSLEFWGAPQKVTANAAARNAEIAARLWAVSQELTGVMYEELTA